MGPSSDLHMFRLFSYNTHVLRESKTEMPTRRAVKYSNWKRTLCTLHTFVLQQKFCCRFGVGWFLTWNFLRISQHWLVHVPFVHLGLLEQHPPTVWLNRKTASKQRNRLIKPNLNILMVIALTLVKQKDYPLVEVETSLKSQVDSPATDNSCTETCTTWEHQSDKIKLSKLLQPMWWSDEWRLQEWILRNPGPCPLEYFYPSLRENSEKKALESTAKEDRIIGLKIKKPKSW